MLSHESFRRKNQGTEHYVIIYNLYADEHIQITITLETLSVQSSNDI